VHKATARPHTASASLSGSSSTSTLSNTPASSGKLGDFLRFLRREKSPRSPASTASTFTEPSSPYELEAEPIIIKPELLKKLQDPAVIQRYELSHSEKQFHEIFHLYDEQLLSCMSTARPVSVQAARIGECGWCTQ
jgi:hypothetical protein